MLHHLLYSMYCCKVYSYTYSATKWVEQQKQPEGIAEQAGGGLLCWLYCSLLPPLLLLNLLLFDASKFCILISIASPKYDSTTPHLILNFDCFYFFWIFYFDVYYMSLYDSTTPTQPPLLNLPLLHIWLNFAFCNCCCIPDICHFFDTSTHFELKIWHQKMRKSRHSWFCDKTA